MNQGINVRKSIFTVMSIIVLTNQYITISFQTWTLEARAENLKRICSTYSIIYQKNGNNRILCDGEPPHAVIVDFVQPSTMS